jgi:hypothetical protein
MAHYVETERKGMKCLELTKPEAVKLVRDLVGMLANLSGSAPGVFIIEGGQTDHRLLFQIGEGP